MSRKENSVINGIESINNDLYDEMFVSELEKRLETDPLLTNGLLNLMTPDGNASFESIDFLCECNTSYGYVVCKGGTY